MQLGGAITANHHVETRFEDNGDCGFAAFLAGSFLDQIPILLLQLLQG